MSKQTIAYDVLTNENSPHFMIGDTLIIDDRINRYTDEGWYIWQGRTCKVWIKSPGMLCAGQLTGDVQDVPLDNFNPSGRVKGRYRPEQ